MSTELYAPIAADVVAALAEAGAELRCYRLTPRHDPLLGTTQFTAQLMLVQGISVRPGRSARDVGASGVRDEVKRFLLSAPGLTVPLQEGDLIRASSGIYFAVTALDPVAPDATNVVAYYVDTKRMPVTVEQRAAITGADLP